MLIQLENRKPYQKNELLFFLEEYKQICLLKSSQKTKGFEENICEHCH